MRINSLSDTLNIKMASKLYDPYLHTDDCINEKQHNNQKCNIWECLKGFDECPQQRTNTFTTAQQFHQTHNTKQPKKQCYINFILRNKQEMQQKGGEHHLKGNSSLFQRRPEKSVRLTLWNNDLFGFWFFCQAWIDFINL